MRRELTAPDVLADELVRPRTYEEIRNQRVREVRACTIAPQRMSKRELAAGAAEFPPDETLGRRPRTRAECESVERPCPFVSCRHHLYLDVHARTGSIKLNFPDLEPDELPADASCSLDIAERGAVTLHQTGALLNVTREAVRQIEDRALHRVAGNPASADVLTSLLEDAE